MAPETEKKPRTRVSMKDRLGKLDKSDAGHRRAIERNAAKRIELVETAKAKLLDDAESAGLTVAVE